MMEDVGKEIVGVVKNYDWGKLGPGSLVAELAALNNDEFKFDKRTPYAELWMGAHPSGTSTVKHTGDELSKAEAATLPFLFKVLSIRKALSIQVHPNKAEAERLHKERPDIYKDPNHKPELAIALTPFLALCGFRPYEEIYQFCQQLPPLKALIGGDVNVEPLRAGGTTQHMRKCYETLMNSSARDTARCIEDIAKNYTKVLEEHNLRAIFETLNRDTPQDVGILSLFVLNLIRLRPGQAIFLGANVIHAYLSGDCVECMACSDNVIRAGLTPKYKDVGQLLACLNYDGLPVSRHIFQPHRIDPHVLMFLPPVEDFAVMQLNLPTTKGDYKLSLQPYAAIMLVLQGERKVRIPNGIVLPINITARRGSVIYIPPRRGMELEFWACDGTVASRKDFIAYIATYNSFKTK